MTERVIALVLDAQSLNAHQQRLNLHQERLIGRAAGLIARMKRTGLDERQCKLVDEAVGLIREFWRSNLSEREANEAERECQRTLAGIIDALPQSPSQRGWTVKRAARVLRAPLGDLCNPLVTGARREAALAIVDDFVATAPAHLLAVSCVSLRHELGVSKFSRLHELIAERMAVAS
jgi:hypothetical protein